MRLRYRPFQAVAIALLAALVTACAGFAPLYDRAMQQALTDLDVERTSQGIVGLQLHAITSDSSRTFAVHQRERPPAPDAVLAKVPDDLRASYLDPVRGYSATATLVPAGLKRPTGQVMWRDGACDHVTFTAGGCPTGAGELAVSEADARIFHLEVGTTFEVVGIPRDDPDAAVPTTRMRVTGVYAQQPGDYWFGLSLTGLSGLLDPTRASVAQHDVWLTDEATFTDPSVPPLPGQASTVDLPLDRTGVGVDDVLALATGIGRLADAARLDDDHAVVEVHSGLPSIARDIREQTDQSRVTVPLLMAQLGLLAVVVLWLVLLAATEQRRSEVALARLRGRGRRGARALLLGELLPVALAGVLPGAAVAMLGAWVARALVLPGHAPFELGWPFVGAVLLAVVVLVAVTVVAVSRVAREPVETLLRRVPPRRAGWALGVGDALVIAGAGAVVVLFATGGLDGPVALAAPGLLAIVVGLVLAHLTTPSAAVVGRRLLARGRVRAGVSVLDAARSPATRRVVAMVTLAAALAVFSTDALLVGDRNRASAADQEAGAPMVVEVRGHDLPAVRDALAEVDPDGRRVTPVVRVLPPGKTTDATLAVEPDAFRRIALFAGSGARSVPGWGRLAPPDAEPLRVTGTRLAFAVEDSTLEARRLDGKTTPVTVGLDLVDETGATLHTAFGELDGSTARTTLADDVSCGDGCFVTGIWFGTLPGAEIHGTATFTDLTGSPGGDRAGFGPATQWTPYDDPTVGSVRPRSEDPQRLQVTVDSGGSALITMAQTWLPGAAPALVSGRPDDDGSTDDLTIVGVDGEDQPAHRVGELPRVPGSPPGTSVVNLEAVTRGRAIAATASLQLWFADDDRALLERSRQALGEQGVAIGLVDTLAETRRGYDESTAAWSLQLAVVVGVAALLIALLVLVVTAVSGWRFRTRDLAALRMGGIPGRSIDAMAVAAQLPAVLLGVVAGTACGLYGAFLALPIVPLFASAPEVSTLDLGTAWTGVAAAAASAVVVLGLGAALIGRTLARRSDVRRLRETL